MTNKKERQHAVGDQMVEAFAGLDCVQVLIPNGFAPHVQAVWDDQVDSPLPAGMMMALIPIDDVPGDAVEIKFRR